MTKVFIDGNQGTTGLRLEERLSKRADIELIYPNPDKRKDKDERKYLINSSDISFLCLPDDAARESASLVENDKTVIIDTSTAHRTNDSWCYGFPELSAEQRQKIKTSKKIASPGCHASGVIALISPLTVIGIMPADYPVCAYSVTGYSGGGKKMIASYEAADRPKAYSMPRQYGLMQSHKHLPEMQKYSLLSAPPAFDPVVCDFYSGMAVTIMLHTRLLNKKVTPSDIVNIYKNHYNGSGLISVRELNTKENDIGFLDCDLYSGKDNMDIFVSGNDDRIILCARYDNLGKGASGAAIQCMNISLGIDEATGLLI